MKDLNQQFAIPSAAQFLPGEGNLTRLEIRTAIAAADIYLHGAHVTHYQRRGEQPILWMSKRSWFDVSEPIRGGVPVIFPWFGPRKDGPKSPNHGFARLVPWEIESVKQANDGVVTAVLTFRTNEQTRSIWPHDAELRYTVVVGSTLVMSLEVRNTGQSVFRFEEALHTYFTVSDVRQISIRGLEGVTYLDKAPGASSLRVTQDGQPITIVSETDRVYMATRSTCVLEDPGSGRRTVIEKDGSDTTVVWNPWIAKAAAMPDFGNDEWTQMVCIETANVGDNAVELAPGTTHLMRATLK
ncbi:MAG: D-hexose-6-phosphate mutarotase [Phycisphaeraceae bacterium]|nr:D-hexose-6-phosphate mutarotase [Phycisphaeraceae bacterium]